MASNPTPAERQSEFEQSVAFALHLWPALSLAVQNNWGGPDSSDKRDWFVGAIADMFPDLSKAKAKPSAAASSAQQEGKDGEGDPDEPDVQDVETTLLQVMVDEFEVNVDDDTAFETAEHIVRARAGCARGNFDESSALRRRWEASRGKKVAMKQAADQDQDTDWEDDDDDDDDDEDGDDDENMDDAPALVAVVKEKPPPEVDEDGFTKVTKKKR